MWSASDTSTNSKDLSIMGGMSGTSTAGQSTDQGSTRSSIADSSSEQHFDFQLIIDNTCSLPKLTHCKHTLSLNRNIKERIDELINSFQSSF
ncbi:unnamed protein product [Rotaria sordida]|uniref:Uncharacterized protein n=1 Tax=Rotaria sordida TaxID=392033 RepID=A0A819V804_9BILA|nr:unnamed protein product [Rotaria sordida]CAF4104896.1 unnamed protein product [Rotaria sordida]